MQSTSHTPEMFTARNKYALANNHFWNRKTQYGGESRAQVQPSKATYFTG